MLARTSAGSESVSGRFEATIHFPPPSFLDILHSSPSSSFPRINQTRANRTVLEIRNPRALQTETRLGLRSEGTHPDGPNDFRRTITEIRPQSPSPPFPGSRESLPQFGLDLQVWISRNCTPDIHRQLATQLIVCNQ